MGKKFVKTTFAILSFMMLLPTSVFAEDAGNMEAAFVGDCLFYIKSNPFFALKRGISSLFSMIYYISEIL